jgi:hypothetical protein
MSDPRYPALYQITTRVWLTELSRALGRRTTLDDAPDAALDRLAEKGFDWVWFLSVWQGALQRRHFRTRIPSSVASLPQRCRTSRRGHQTICSKLLGWMAPRHRGFCRKYF